MSLRILSGLVFVRRGGTRVGHARITFRPFELASSSKGVALKKKKAIGRNARFRSTPASIVAARQFALLIGTPVLEVRYRMKIDDKVTRDSIRISWRSKHQRVDQEEIPFLIIGEVPDAQPGHRPRPRR